MACFSKIAHDTEYFSESSSPSLSPSSEPAQGGPAEGSESRLPPSEGQPENTKPETGARAGEAETSAAGHCQPRTVEDDSVVRDTAARYDLEAPLFVGPGPDSGSDSESSSPSGVMSAGLPSETSGSPPSTIPTSPETDTTDEGTSERKNRAAEIVGMMFKKGREPASHGLPYPATPPPPSARLVEAVSDAEHMPPAPPLSEPVPEPQLTTFLSSKDPGEPTVVVTTIPSLDVFEPAAFPEESNGDENASHLDTFDDVEFAAQYQDEEGIGSPLVQATEEGEIGDAMLDDLGDAEVELGPGSSPTRRRDSLKAQQDVMEVIEEVDEEAVRREEEMAERRIREVEVAEAPGAGGDGRGLEFVEDGDEDAEIEHVEHARNTRTVDRDAVGDPQSGPDKSFHNLRPKRTCRKDALSGSERGVDDEEAHTSGPLHLPLLPSSPACRNNHCGRSPLQLPFDQEEGDALSRYPELRDSMTMSTAELQTWLKTDQPPGLPQEDLQSWLTGGHFCGQRREPASQLPFNPFRSKPASASSGAGGEGKPWEYKFGKKLHEMTTEQRIRGRRGKGAPRDTPQDIVDSDSEWESMSDEDDEFGYPLEQFPRRVTTTALARSFKAQAESYGYRLERISSKIRPRSPVDDMTLRPRSRCPAPTGSSSPPSFGRRSTFEILQDLDEDKALTSPFTEINVVVDHRAPAQPVQTPAAPQPFSNLGKFPFIQHDDPIITPHFPDSDSDSSSVSIITVIGPNTPAGAAWMQFYAFLGTRQRALLGNRVKTRSIYYGGLWHGFWLEKKGAYDYFPSEDWEWTEPLRKWRRGGVVVETKRPAIIIRPKEGEEKVLVGKEGRKKVVVDVEGGKEVMVLERGVKVEGEVTVVKTEVEVDVLIPVKMCREID